MQTERAEISSIMAAGMVPTQKYAALEQERDELAARLALACDQRDVAWSRVAQQAARVCALLQEIEYLRRQTTQFDAARRSQSDTVHSL